MIVFVGLLGKTLLDTYIVRAAEAAGLCCSLGAYLSHLTHSHHKIFLRLLELASLRVTCLPQRWPLEMADGGDTDSEPDISEVRLLFTSYFTLLCMCIWSSFFLRSSRVVTRVLIHPFQLG